MLKEIVQFQRKCMCVDVTKNKNKYCMLHHDPKLF